jgi:HNH endonuclease
MTECIPWEGTRFTNGYGRIGDERAHRVAWEQEHGPIPPGMVVMHLCNNPACVNLDHLKVGTQSENIRQAVQEGRGFIGPMNGRWGHGLSGTRNGRAKLSAIDIREIRTSDETQQALADRFGVTQSNISKIKARTAWKDD